MEPVTRMKYNCGGSKPAVKEANYKSWKIHNPHHPLLFPLPIFLPPLRSTSRLKLEKKAWLSNGDHMWACLRSRLGLGGEKTLFWVQLPGHQMEIICGPVQEFTWVSVVQIWVLAVLGSTGTLVDSIQVAIRISKACRWRSCRIDRLSSTIRRCGRLRSTAQNTIYAPWLGRPRHHGHPACMK